MAKITDLHLNAPTNKTELTKNNMLKYVKEHGTVEDKTWFVELMKTNQEEKKNNLTGEVGKGYNLPVIREEFAKKFFPTISKEYKDNQKKESSKKRSFEEELEDLLKAEKTEE